MFGTHTKQVVMVTGAGGSIGSELARQIFLERPKRLYIVDQCELSLFNIMTRLQELPHIKYVDLRPILINCASDEFVERCAGEQLDFMYHVAAYKHVNMSEANPGTYYRNNIMATYHSQCIASAANAKFVLVSTDKAVHPTNVMGRSKRLCEMLVLAEANLKESVDRTSIVRFGNVLNSSGSVIPIFKTQIDAGGPVTVTDRHAERFFMSITEATSLVVDSIRVHSKQGIFVLDMGPAVNIHSLACNLIEQAGHNVTYESPGKGEIKIEFIGLRPGEKVVEELSYGKVSATEIARVNSAEERCTFGEAEHQLCLQFGRGNFSELPSGFTWEEGIGPNK